jgi:hypothetical protein
VSITRPDDEILPADPVRRRIGTVLGCFTLLLLLALLAWFIATHTQTFENPGMFGS